MARGARMPRITSALGLRLVRSPNAGEIVTEDEANGIIEVGNWLEEMDVVHPLERLDRRLSAQ